MPKLLRRALICAVLSLSPTRSPSAADKDAPQTAPSTAQPAAQFELRDGLANARRQFERERRGRIAFLGGSITASSGWRDQVIAWFRQRFPETEFDFISAGIPSLGSVPHAFRLERDILSRGPVDLLFVEAAVNDTTNTPEPERMLRGMEGVVRHVREANPLTDIVQMHFVMPEHLADYRQGRTPTSIAQHERVAEAYGNVSVHLSREVTQRIDAGEFTWEGDFKNLHPSPFGHRLYAESIIRMAEAAFAGPVADEPRPHPLPEPVDSRSYSRGRFGSIADVRMLRGFKLDPAWKPADGKGTRAGFVDVPALTATEPGAEFEFDFDGTAVGLFITAGPDTGRIEARIDGGSPRSVDTFTQWSPGLHLPWAAMLADDLPPGRHVVRVSLSTERHPQATGTALRVFHLLLN